MLWGAHCCVPRPRMSTCEEDGESPVLARMWANRPHRNKKTLIHFDPQFCSLRYILLRQEQ